MSLAYGVRLPWEQIPAHVRAWAVEQLGSPVVDSVTQPGGFSPGLAARVVTAAGTRGFVKAVGPEPNPDSANIYRREAAVMSSMPDRLPVPGCSRCSTTTAGWPCCRRTSRAATRTAHGPPLTRARRPRRWRRSVPTERRRAGPSCRRSWLLSSPPGSRLAAEVPDDLDPWATAHLGQLEALARTTLPRLAGDRVVHSDARSDNLIVEPGGAVRVVDWPWAARGAAWFDVASLLINIRVYATWTCNRSWQ